LSELQRIGRAAANFLLPSVCIACESARECGTRGRENLSLAIAVEIRPEQGPHKVGGVVAAGLEVIVARRPKLALPARLAGLAVE